MSFKFSRKLPLPIRLEEVEKFQNESDKRFFGCYDYLHWEWSRAQLHPDFLVAMLKLFSPDFVEIEGHVFLVDRFDEVRYEQIKANSQAEGVEFWMNCLLLEDYFVWHEKIVVENAMYVLETLSKLWLQKLKADFPERSFETVIFGGEDAEDFGLTFRQRADRKSSR